jgi:hypothetical protein
MYVLWIITAWMVWRLYRAAETGKITNRGKLWDHSTDPTGYWSQVAVHVVLAVIFFVWPIIDTLRQTDG